MTLADHALINMTHGPNRVIINIHGEATTPARAAKKGIRPEVIFIRKDGWSLGAPRKWAYIAENMWKDEWIGVMKDGKVSKYVNEDKKE